MIRRPPKPPLARRSAASDVYKGQVNGPPSGGTVLAGTPFSINVAGSDLAADTSFDATVSGTDGAGNPFSATTTSTHTVDTAAAATISVDNITADDIVNALEAGGTIAVTGTVGGDAAPGDSVSFPAVSYTHLTLPAERSSVDLGGTRTIKKKTNTRKNIN